MKATLIRDEKLVGTADVPDGTKVVVLLDTRGYANDVYLLDGDSFKFAPSSWIGLDALQK